MDTKIKSKKTEKLITYQISLPESVAQAIARRGATHSPLRSRKRQTEIELCHADGFNLETAYPMGKKGPKAQVS